MSCSCDERQSFKFIRLIAQKFALPLSLFRNTELRVSGTHKRKSRMPFLVWAFR